MLKQYKNNIFKFFEVLIILIITDCRKNFATTEMNEGKIFDVVNKCLNSIFGIIIGFFIIKSVIEFYVAYTLYRENMDEVFYNNSKTLVKQKVKAGYINLIIVIILFILMHMMKNYLFNA